LFGNKKKKNIVVIDIAAVFSDYDKKKLEDEGYIVVYVHGDPNRAVSIIKA